MTPEGQEKKKRLANTARLAAIRLAKEQGKSLTLSSLAQESSEPKLILPRLYLGNYWHATNEDQLKRLGVTHIVSVMDHAPALAFSKEYRARLKSLQIPIRDTTVSAIANPYMYFNMVVDFIREAMEENETNIVLVHCFKGRNRAPTFVAAYLLATTSDFDVPDSVTAVTKFLSKKVGVPLSLNFGFRNNLNTWSMRCKSQRLIRVDKSRDRDRKMDVDEKVT